MRVQQETTHRGPPARPARKDADAGGSSSSPEAASGAGDLADGRLLPAATRRAGGRCHSHAPHAVSPTRKGRFSPQPEGTSDHPLYGEVIGRNSYSESVLDRRRQRSSPAAGLRASAVVNSGSDKATSHRNCSAPTPREAGRALKRGERTRMIAER